MSPVFAAPALPLHTAGPYVAAAYCLFVAVLLVYLGIMALRLVRSQRDLEDLRRQVEQRELDESAAAPSYLGMSGNEIHSEVVVGGEVPDTKRSESE